MRRQSLNLIRMAWTASRSVARRATLALAKFIGVVFLTPFSPIPAQQSPPIRPLGPVVARTEEALGYVAGIRHLSNNTVLLNDLYYRRVLLFDSTLTRYSVVADTTSTTSSLYGRSAAFIAYTADSTILVEPTSLSMYMLDPSGEIRRVMAVPRVEDVVSLGGGPFGNPGFDAAGRLVYRAMPRTNVRGPVTLPDSAPIVRIDLVSRHMDTLAFLRVAQIRLLTTRDADSRMVVTREVNPLPVLDDWAVLADGSIGIVRGRDYHVDWLRPDGSRSSSPRMAFPWQRLTDDDKAAIVDSAKAAAARSRAISQPATTNPANRNSGTRPPEVTFVLPSEITDHRPAFFPGAVRADADNNLWIRTTAHGSSGGGPVYDVVNSNGELKDRVQVPAGRAVLGFGPGGIVYLVGRHSSGSYVERAFWR
jgi:hypothetical protein